MVWVSWTANVLVVKLVSIYEPERVSPFHQPRQPIRRRRGNSQAVWSRCTYAGAVPELLLPEEEAAALATVCPRAPRRLSFCLLFCVSFLLLLTSPRTPVACVA